MNVRGSILLVAAVTLLLGTRWSPAATPFMPPENPPRFLIVVEKSNATRPVNDAIRQTVFDLVYHGANGHMPDGSVFELWTFGKETTFRGFTPQMLTPDNRLQKASLASAYVRAATNSGPPNVAQLAEHVRGVESLGYELTILLVTSPITRLEGTSRDEAINGFFELNMERMKEALRPFVTAFRIQDGEIKAHSVNDSTFTMSVPAMPLSPLTDEERAVQFAEARRVRAERDRPSPKPVTVAATAPTQVRRLDPDIPDDEREGAIILRGTPRKAEPVPVETAPSTQVATPAGNPPAEAPVVPSVENVTGSLTKPPPVKTAATTESPAPVVEPPTVPAKTAAPIVQSGPAANNPPTNSSPFAPIASNPGSWLTAGGLFTVGLGFFVVAGLLSWVLMRRARAVSGPSYITRSLDHPPE